MSDDDAEKSKLDIKQKPKMKESKSLVKEDSRSHESNKFDEDIHASNFDDATEFEGTMDHANDLAVDMEGKMPSNIMEHVFGSEEIDDFGEDSEEHIRGEETVQGENLHSQFTEEKGPANLHSNKDFQSENNFEDTQKIYTGDSDALGTDAALDNLVERISESKDMETGVSGGNRGVPSTSQQDHKSFIKSGGYGPMKNTDKRKVDSESVVRVNLDKKDRDVHPSTDGKGALKNITSYVEPNAHLENSHVEKDEPQQNINKVLPERLAQVSTEARKGSSKKSTTKGHEKFERAKTSDSTVKRKSPSNSAHIAGALKFDDERMDRLSDRGGAETCDFMEVKQKKEKVPDERTLDSSRSGDISGRQSRDFERHLQQKDSVGAIKGSAHRISRDSNYSSASYDKDALHMDKSSKMKHGRQKSETSDRTGLVVEQAERPLADVDSARKGKDLYGKSILKETESGGRISGGELSNVKAKDMGNLGESFQSHSRGHLRDNSRASMETFETRDPPVENGMVESKKRVPPMEDSRGKATSGAMGRFSYKGSLSPDQDDYQAFDRRTIDIQKQSPGKAFEDSRHHAYDGRNAKRRIDEVENTDLERSKRNANAGHSKQAQNKEEWFQTGSVKQGYVEKGKFSVSDFQDYKCASKFSAFENSVRSDEESDELYKQQRAGQTHATPNGMRRDNIRAAGDFVDNSKRQTPQSIELLEGSEYFAPYEKDKPDLRNQIKTFIEYKEYCREYCEKHPVYLQLHEELEKTRRLFESLKKDKERARSKGDEKKSTFTNERIREEYNLHRKIVVHEMELFILGELKFASFTETEAHA
ncbi:hypothetical protein KP509_05G022400 [Ceratopteris richardii]|nr:hypothetical protein KP509_05G022400 [Ceratopteris richardii]